jgi:sterol desaturase/sphingolipid hydroxylase (fatty acid hydroxylase superfamily)
VTELVLRSLLFAGLVGLAFAPLERHSHAHPPGRSGVWTDIAFATLAAPLVQVALFTVVGALLAVLETVAPSAPLLLGLNEPWRSAGNVMLGLLIFELAGYTYHRLAHAVPWMWRLHEVHHSAERMDWLASFRQHPLETLLLTLIQNVPLVLLGVPLASHAAVLLFMRVHTVFVHANLRVPAGAWTEVLATPRFHHRHHQREGAVRNYASLLPFLDRVFGTHSAQTAVRFGVRRQVPEGFTGLLALPFRRRARARRSLKC